MLKAGEKIPNIMTYVKGEWKTPGRHQDPIPHAAEDMEKLAPSKQNQTKTHTQVGICVKWYKQSAKQFDNFLTIKHIPLLWSRNSMYSYLFKKSENACL